AEEPDLAELHDVELHPRGEVEDLHGRPVLGADAECVEPEPRPRRARALENRAGRSRGARRADGHCCCPHGLQESAAIRIGTELVVAHDISGICATTIGDKPTKRQGCEAVMPTGPREGRSLAASQPCSLAAS